MKILLINSNPVVSRLFALCTDDEGIELDEVEEVEDAKGDKQYDLLFVDDASYCNSIKEYVKDHPVGKKVFLSYLQANVHGFDMTLKKPFLPSQVLEIVRSVDTGEEESEQEEEAVIFPLEEDTYADKVAEEETPSIFPLSTEEREEVIEEENISESPHILDSREIERIKSLLDMDEEDISAEEELPEEVVEQRKVEAIKAQLIADGLEIVEEEEIVETLDTGRKSKKKKKKAETGPFSKEEFDAIQKAFTAALLKLKPKKIRKLLKGKKTEITLKLKDTTDA